MPIAQVNGQRLYYEDTGGTGPAVIFSHGLFMDHEMFAPQVAALRRRYRCITWDERGHGLSASDRLAPFSYYDSAADLAAILSHLGIGEAVLVGMSQGGFLSLRCALTPSRRRSARLDAHRHPGRPGGSRRRLQGYLAAHRTNGRTAGLETRSAAASSRSIILGDSPRAERSRLAREVAALRWRQHQGLHAYACWPRRHQCQARRDQGSRPGDPRRQGRRHSARSGGEEARGGPGRRRSWFVVAEASACAANLTHPEAVNPAIERFLAELG